jgi:hypothetical protein
MNKNAYIAKWSKMPPHFICSALMMFGIAFFAKSKRGLLLK